MGVSINGWHTDVTANGLMMELLDEAILFSDMHPAAAQKDPLPDAPDTTSLGVADAAGSIPTSTVTNNSVEGESAMFEYELPVKYQVGAAISVIIRCRVSANRDTAQIVDVVAKLWQPGGTLGADICTTAAQTVTTAYAAYTFAINPATLNPGDLLNIVWQLGMDDSGGGSGAGTATATQVSMQVGIKE